MGWLGPWARNGRLLQAICRLWLLGQGRSRTLRQELPPACRLMGLAIPNPIGLAAGIDRGGQLLPGTARAGFGFSEVGSVSPKTLAISRRRLSRVRAAGAGLVHGVNIRPRSGATVAEMMDDYLDCLNALLPVADYLVLNLSSPFARRGWAADPLWLETLLTRAVAMRDRYCRTGGRRVPLAIKVVVAPRLSFSQRHGLLLSRRAGLDGVVLVAAPGQAETAVCNTLRQVKSLLGEMALISVGGIADASQLSGRLAAGATAVQLFSAVLSQGVMIPRKLLEPLQPKPDREAA
ncbi:hypothetical protein [Sedimenticola sp.]|uniref:hypothetical protein n=1 Tax=Sedimenticola sp. TaxID=1940285 RepID=UPI0025910E9D|nr:hypothetical protein [Sedimenticola sp.]MCW8905195.1 hypothetical protein [Sedimenticola sp.]